MKIGIGIDTGGTCTDAVVYHFADKKILAYAKTHTTKDDLSRGIGRALDRLPLELVEQAEVIALSTTLATNACVENKGGRAKLVMFGAAPAVVQKHGETYGLSLDDSLLMVDSQTRTSGEIVNPPDWDEFSKKIETEFSAYESAGVVEMFAKKTGAVLEIEARKRIQEVFPIPVVCGNELFSEYNIVKRGASTLLNARLISIIAEFTKAVKIALKQRNIKAPFVIVRSDGSLMTEKFAKTRPIETLLCGPVASVMGAAELSNTPNCMVVDMGGTTTDIAFVKDGEAKKVAGGVHIGKWNTFVKGLFVDTFGLGGDSGVVVTDHLEIALEAEKVMPLSMTASRYPGLLPRLKRMAEQMSYLPKTKDEIYLAVRNIQDNGNYTPREQQIAAAFYQDPKSLDDGRLIVGDVILSSQIERLVREGVLIRCGVTPTDAMHCLGDFTKYSVEAAQYGLTIMARLMQSTKELLCDAIYDAVKKKLYCQIVRILLEDAYPTMGEQGIGEQLEFLVTQSYENAKTGNHQGFLQLAVQTPATLVGVGAPTHIFLKDVGALLGTPVVTSQYSQVANALGAVVGNVCAKKMVEVVLEPADGSYTIFGCGKRDNVESLEEAKALAKVIATDAAQKEAELRGSVCDTTVTLEEHEDVVESNYGAIFMGYRVTAVVAGELDLHRLYDTAENG